MRRCGIELTRAVVLEELEEAVGATDEGVEVAVVVEVADRGGQGREAVAGAAVHIPGVEVEERIVGTGLELPHRVVESPQVPEVPDGQGVITLGIGRRLEA